MCKSYSSTSCTQMLIWEKGFKAKQENISKLIYSKPIEWDKETTLNSKWICWWWYLCIQITPSFLRKPENNNLTCIVRHMCGTCAGIWHMVHLYKCLKNLFPWPTFDNLTHLPRGNGCHFADDIFRCICVNEKFCFLIKFHWSLFLRVQLTITQHWFRQWLGAE